MHVDDVAIDLLMAHRQPGPVGAPHLGPTGVAACQLRGSMRCWPATPALVGGCRTARLVCDGGTCAPSGATCCSTPPVCDRLRHLGQPALATLRGADAGLPHLAGWPACQ